MEIQTPSQVAGPRAADSGGAKASENSGHRTSGAGSGSLHSAGSSTQGDFGWFCVQPPINALRLSLHPDGLAPRIANLPEWREHALRRQVELTADRELIELLRKLTEYAKPMADRRDDRRVGQEAVGVAFRIHSALGLLSFRTTTTIFGTPLDVTLSELALECFYPADAATAELVRNRGGGQRRRSRLRAIVR